jgi:hypothetical protein
MHILYLHQHFSTPAGSTATRSFAFARALAARGHRVVFRPHPHPRGEWLRLPDVETSTGTLAEALDGAAFAVTCNSNSAVDAVLAGVPTVTLDYGAMAWDVTSHDLDQPIVTPDRDAWAAWLAGVQWSHDEIRSGTAWASVSRAMP